MTQLIKENPDLEVYPMVDSECVSDEGSHQYWLSEWGKSSVEEIYTSDERVYIRSLDEDELNGDAIYPLIEHLSNKEYEENAEYWDKLAEEEVANLPWKTVILVYIESN